MENFDGNQNLSLLRTTISAPPTGPKPNLLLIPGMPTGATPSLAAQKLQDDRFYRENQQDAQRAWRDRNPDYSRNYRVSIWPSGIPAGIYRIRPVPTNEIANMDAWIVEIFPVCGDWLAMLESGEFSTMTEIAKREGIDNSYVSRMVNLTTLAPDSMGTTPFNGGGTKQGFSLGSGGQISKITQKPIYPPFVPPTLFGCQYMSLYTAAL